MVGAGKSSKGSTDKKMRDKKKTKTSKENKTAARNTPSQPHPSKQSTKASESSKEITKIGKVVYDGPVPVLIEQKCYFGLAELNIHSDGIA